MVRILMELQVLLGSIADLENTRVNAGYYQINISNQLSSE
jgi:hypothetical protein